MQKSEMNAIHDLLSDAYQEIKQKNVRIQELEAQVAQQQKLIE